MIKKDGELHPGPWIKAEVIPKGMSVTQAAALMGVGRVALSNLLNGKAALSTDMAARLEKAFNYPRKDLLQLQANYDAAQAKLRNGPADTKAYVPPFLSIKANQIEEWGTRNLLARSRLSVFLRMLVHSTGRALTKVDFPANDDAERPGWDGFVEAGEGTPWVPVGRSGWEFGVSEDIKTKADKDFDKSAKALLQKDRQETTFVFVTPRRWKSKGPWLDRMKKTKRWKDVRAYDASDLEQWLEQSLPAQAWFASETDLPAQGVRSLDKCWSDWANVSKPPLAGALFASAMEAAKRTMLSRLVDASDGPIVIAADSTDEALAFVAQLFGEGGGESLAVYRNRVLVFEKPGVLPRLAQGAETFIAVIFTREVERELGSQVKPITSIVVYPRNVANTRPHIVLEPANYETFEKALQQMGKNRDQISKLANESGRSLTVLRRRLAIVPAVKTPEWAADHETAASLVPFLFVGAWHTENTSDTSALSFLAGNRSYEELEKECQRLTQLNDAPTWSLGTYRGVVSKIDVLYAIAAAITPEDLRRYFSIARQVLSEDDPALDLEEGQRWAASLRGKKRQYSRRFREGISETLVLLAVHGVPLFQSRLGVDTESEAARVVRDLLPKPLTTRVLEANDHDLPTYAEAAPDEFLSILESDLETDQPAVLGLLRPASSGMLGHPSRTGLIWALEGLSWNPKTVGRAALILARLSQVEINDNWANRPSHSLGSIFRAWMPQTAASEDARVTLMKTLSERFPNIAWKICLAQFGGAYGIGDFSYKPRWRPDGYGFGEPLETSGPIQSFTRAMVKMALGWKTHTLSTLTDLIERLYCLDDEAQATVWILVERWASNQASDDEKARMRETVRVSTLSRRAVMRARGRGGQAALSAKARAACMALEPRDLLNKHAWLFRDPWVEESAEEVNDIDNFDYARHAERIKSLRVEAMREVLAERQLKGLLALAKLGKTSWQIGSLAANHLLTPDELQELLRLAFQEVLTQTDGGYPFKDLIAGAATAIAEGDERNHLLKQVGANLPEEDLAQLLVLAPFTSSTWRLVDTLGAAARAMYWSSVAPEGFRNSDEDRTEGVERLLKAGRPRAAFSCIGHQSNKLDAQLLYCLLSEVAKGGRNEPSGYLLEEHDVQAAFEHLDKSPVVALEQKAVLELAFLDVLAWPRGSRRDGIRNLELYIESHPELYVRAITWVYARSDGEADPSELEVPPDRQKDLAERGYKLLNAIVRIPGHDAPGELKAERLATWVAAVRHSCAVLSRAEIADHCIGNLLAHAPVGGDGLWPSEPVRQVIEDIRSESMTAGAHNGVFNSRGIHARGEGGEQERALAAKYRKWGEALQFSHPHVSCNLLMKLARTYDHEGSREDTEAGIRRRLR